MGTLETAAAVALPLDHAFSPLEALARFGDLPHPCLLHSASASHDLGRYTFLAADPVELFTASAESWPSLRERVRSTFASDRLPFADLPPFQGGWMGWFGYELGTAFDRVARHPQQDTGVPDVSLALYDWVIAWDHRRRSAWLISTGADASGRHDPVRSRHRAGAMLERWKAPGAGTLARTRVPVVPQSNFTAAEYRIAVARAIDHVLAGDIFEVNIAQRFSAPFDGDPLSICHRLNELTAAPMAAFVQHDDISVVSASPERFLRFDPRTRQVETRPIKGTRPRNANAGRDAELARELQASEKDRAENVMIVDLLRNDLSRVCDAGSVRVPVLCALESHATVHHLISIITGGLRAGCDALDLLAATFPGGSITGAPKLRAMEIITELEPVARNVYSGCIAWIGFDGGMDSSIAIRTITVCNGIATWHAGGAVTADSNPDHEYAETLDKARALTAAIVAA